MRALASKLGLGRLALYAWHRPLGLLKQSIAEGGPLEQRRTEAGRKEMVAAAMQLQKLEDKPDTFGAKIHFLSGQKYWYQTLFCFVSLQIRVPFRITPVIFDDGSLGNDTAAIISLTVPWAQFVKIKEIEERLNQVLPVSRFPMLRQRRIQYPHLRKLTDLHAGSTERKTVFDSDMLFFNQPDEVIEILKSPVSSYICDVTDYYGYDVDWLSSVLGIKMLSSVNVGLYTLDGKEINWDQVEHWCHRQINHDNGNYLQEQALTAMLLTQQSAVALPRNRYVVNPNYNSGRYPTASLHHYVSESKRYYYQFGWKHVSTDMKNLN